MCTKKKYINNLQDFERVQVGDGRGVGADVLPILSTYGGGDLTGGGPNPKRGRRLTRHRYRGGGVEGGGGDYQSPLHRLHHLPQLPPWIPVGSKYGDRHP